MPLIHDVIDTKIQMWYYIFYNKYLFEFFFNILDTISENYFVKY